MAHPVRDEDYAAMADDYAANPPTADEVTAADIIRRAVDEYLSRHPVTPSPESQRRR